MKITFTVNGRERALETAPLTRLLDLLRDGLNLKGCKEGCGEGECGACAVIMNGRLVNACMVPAIQAAGAEILTIEGLGGENGPGDPDALQQAFIDEGAVHCGFCTPGMILAARVLMERGPAPSRRETKVALSGNLCRCTGYNRIFAAVDAAARNGYRPAPSGPGRRFRPEFSPDERERFFAPETLAEALDILAGRPDLTLLCGSTDIGPDMKSGKLRPTGAMDIFSLPELNVLERRGDTVHIGACVTNADLEESPLIRELLPALHTAARECAAPAVRNRASIGGNLCTASGAADLPVALLALGADLCLRGRGRERAAPVHEFIKGYRKPDLQPGEILTEIRVPVPPAGAAQVFYKRGSREALTLARVSLSLYAELDGRRIVAARAGAGAMSPAPARLPRLEAALAGRDLGPATIDAAVRTLREELSPRKSPAYRKAVAGNLLRRFLESL